MQFEIAQEAERRLREFLASNRDESSINLEPSTSRGGCNTRNVTSRVSDDYWTNDSSSSVRNIGATSISAATKSIFIRKLELTINGTPIDQVKVICFFSSLWLSSNFQKIFFLSSPSFIILRLFIPCTVICNYILLYSE